MENLTLLTYTHSKCSDLHPAYFSRIQKHFPALRNNVVTCNVDVPQTKCLVYDDSTTHSSQMINALDSLDTDFVIYSQEDYVLYNRVDVDAICRYMKVLSSDNSIGFIRLIKSGVGNLPKAYNNELWYIDQINEYFFSTQITIWKRAILTDMYRRSQVLSIFDEAQNSPFLREMGIDGLYTTQLGKQVGGHYDSLVYPYIATAKVKGQWNVKEYPNELDKLFTEFNLK